MQSIDKKFFIVDGSSYLYRAFYAIQGLSNSKGIPTNAVFGVVNMVMKLLKEHTPEYMCFCYDLPGPTFRHKEFADYKAQRKPTPDALIVQIPIVKEVISSLGIPDLEYPGYEADDLMAALAEMAEKHGFETYLVTGDKDILQLVTSRVFVMRVTNTGTEIYDEAAVIEKYGVPPKRFPDVIGLIGDSVDNIPGVPGIGEKTARILLQEFGDLDNLLAHIGGIKSKRQQELLTQYAEQARKSRDLAQLNSDIPMEFEIEAYKMKPMNSNRLREIFKELEFGKLLDQLNLPSESRQPLKTKYLQSTGDFEEFMKIISQQESIAFCLDRQIETVAIYADGVSYLGNLNEMYKQLMEKINLNSTKICSYDIKSYMTSMGEMNNSKMLDWFDIEIACYLLKPHRGHPTLSILALEYLGKQLTNYEKSEELDFNQEVTLSNLAKKSEIVFEIAKVVEPLLNENKLIQLFTEIEMPLIPILAKMEYQGIKINIPYLKELSAGMTHQINMLGQEIFKISGEEFNINSPKQLAKILFEKLLLPVGKRTRTKSGYSTNVDVLEELSVIHPLPEKILEYRSLVKLQSTYVDTLIQMAHPETATIHTSFQQTVASTGRIISTEPNLQNLPIHTDWGDKIRKAFIPRERNHLFLSADYSQIELRILAHLSQDEALMQAFRDNKDIHTDTAVRLFGMKPEDVTPQMRRSAKAINFGIVYGMSAFGLSKSLKISVTEAQLYITSYFQKYPKVREYLDETMKFAREHGYVATLFGRRCYVPDIQNPQTNLREAAERQAINAPLQGSAADLLKKAMIKVDQKIREQKLHALLLLTIHDELVFECSELEIKILENLVKEEMESAMLLSIPVLVDISIGNNLADC